MWYNHLLNTQTAWMGALDAFSGHGDCGANGEKWIANIWIDIIGDGKHELRSWKSGTNWIKPGTKDIELYAALGNLDLRPKSDYDQFKERYSPAMNMRPDTNVNIGDIRLHFDDLNQNSATESRADFIGAKQEESPGHSKILQSVLLLLDEIKQNELEVVSDVLKRKTSPQAGN